MGIYRVTPTRQDQVLVEIYKKAKARLWKTINIRFV